MNYLRKIIVLGAVSLLSATVGHAATLNGTGNVTPDVIFGSGNANGSFTGETRNNVEVGLRGKQRYPAANIFNYDGIDTYTFDTTTLTTNPTNRSVFNFEWAVNVDASGTSGDTLNDFIHFLEVDTDAGAGISFVGIDPFFTPGYFDHSLGSNTTPNGGGVESANDSELFVNAGIYSVAQQSSNLGFGFSLDPDAPGSYAFRYSVFDSGSILMASSQININAQPLPLTPVPLPAAGLLLVGGLGALGAFGRKRRKAA